MMTFLVYKSNRLKNMNFKIKEIEFNVFTQIFLIFLGLIVVFYPNFSTFDKF